jgi:hypothetical protein
VRCITEQASNSRMSVPLVRTTSVGFVHAAPRVALAVLLIVQGRLPLQDGQRQVEGWAVGIGLQRKQQRVIIP